MSSNNCAQCLSLGSQLRQSQQREATLTLERDAALNTIQYARNLVDRLLFLADRECLHERLTEVLEINPSALAERDRAIERKTAERCAEIVSGYIYSGYIRREFNLDTLA